MDSKAELRCTARLPSWKWIAIDGVLISILPFEEAALRQRSRGISFPCIGCQAYLKKVPDQHGSKTFYTSGIRRVGPTPESMANLPEPSFFSLNNPGSM